MLQSGFRDNEFDEHPISFFNPRIFDRFTPKSQTSPYDSYVLLSQEFHANYLKYSYHLFLKAIRPRLSSSS